MHRPAVPRPRPVPPQGGIASAPKKRAPGSRKTIGPTLGEVGLASAELEAPVLVDPRVLALEKLLHPAPVLRSRLVDESGGPHRRRAKHAIQVFTGEEGNRIAFRGRSEADRDHHERRNDEEKKPRPHTEEIRWRSPPRHRIRLWKSVDRGSAVVETKEKTSPEFGQSHEERLLSLQTFRMLGLWIAAGFRPALHRARTPFPQRIPLLCDLRSTPIKIMEIGPEFG